MKNSIKGVLLSGLVFPGLGQIVLKRYRRGIALVLATAAGLAVFVAQATSKALSILKDISSQGESVDLNTVSDAAARASAAGGDTILDLALLLIVCCWILGMVDAYRIGKQLDQA